MLRFHLLVHLYLLVLNSYVLFVCTNQDSFVFCNCNCKDSKTEFKWMKQLRNVVLFYCYRYYMLISSLIYQENEVKDLCKELGLHADGSKVDLISRLQRRPRVPEQQKRIFTKINKHSGKPFSSQLRLRS